ncbi:hypothetical protein [Nocardia bovistercoris]|nr:hypothetical protein [Nocardia bovistercoris]
MSTPHRPMSSTRAHLLIAALGTFATVFLLGIIYLARVGVIA